MSRATKGRAVFYTRDSGGKHEMTPAQYVAWAQDEATRRGLTFSGNADDIQTMIAANESQHGDLFLDYNVAGNQLTRQGLTLLQSEIERDETISHVFIPRRDRLARPDDALEGMRLEAQLRKRGVTLVFMDRVVAPAARGERADVAGLILGLVDYHQAGKERQDLARKVIYAQIALAQAGYSIGGRPPYGFRRWLVRDDGTRVRELSDGERVRMRGHHVVWLPVPDDHPHMQTIRRILTMLETISAARVAATLTAEGVPSPDAQRKRTDNGIVHRVSGAWHQTTISNIARNPLLQALVVAGRRSMGDQLRYSVDGPRSLTDTDYRGDEQPKVIRNPDASQIVARAHFTNPLVDIERHQNLLATLDERAGSQRGKPRSRDPQNNPLGSRVFDMHCGWPMYRAPYQKSFRYVCGCYTQSHGARCGHHHIAGPLATRLALSCLIQKALGAENGLAKLRQRIEALASAEQAEPIADPNAQLKQELDQLQKALPTIERNLALSETPSQRAAVARVYDDHRRRIEELERQIGENQAAASAIDPQDDVDSAMAALNRLPELVEKSSDLAAVGAAFKLVNAKLYLQFTPVKLTKRTVNKIAGGVITFGDAPAPVPLYHGRTGRTELKNHAAMVAAGPEGVNNPLPDQILSGQEGKSLGNVSRGDRI